jgi:hypothetical protein
MDELDGSPRMRRTLDEVPLIEKMGRHGVPTGLRAYSTSTGGRVCQVCLRLTNKLVQLGAQR